MSANSRPETCDGFESQIETVTNLATVLTKCSLAAIMAAQPINPKTGQHYRPLHLPPPTEVPLRHCSHNQESSPIDEVECLLSLLSPTPGTKKNKEHYTLATADPPAAKKADKNDSAQHRRRKREEEREEEQAMRRAKSLRIGARSIPGVPIIYVKRSVMVLEPMSTPSEAIRDGVELSKLRAGLDAEPTLGKRKRETGGDGDAAPEKKKKPGMKKIKGPNPLSVKKSKKKVEPSGPAKSSQKDQSQPDRAGPKEAVADASEKPEGEESATAKTKRRRRHHKGGPREGNDDGIPSADPGHAMEVDA